MDKEKKNTTSTGSELNALVAKHLENLDSNGKLQLPEDMEPNVKEIIRLSKRTRDAQSALTKTQSKLRASEAANKVLNKVAANIIPEDFKLSEEDTAELNSLKFKDPDQYRLRLNDLETKAIQSQSTILEEKTSKAVKEANTNYEATSRVEVLNNFRIANPSNVISDEALVNDVPPRILNGVNSGEYSYHEYLVKANDYLSKGKATQEAAEEQHNLANMTGGKTPGKKAAENAGKNDYKKLTF